MEMNKALLLDRDGVINVEKNYVHKIEDFVFIEGIFELVRFFRKKGFKIIVITNQAGIARGFYTEDDFKKLNDWMLSEFSKKGTPIDEVFYCPFHPENGIGEYKKDSYERKPNPGMILKAKEKYNLDLSNSWLIGDKASDIQAGISGGVGNNILLNTYSSTEKDNIDNPDVKVFDGLPDILKFAKDHFDCLKEKSKLKIAILTLAGFPEGMAVTNRVFYYAKGLQENGSEVEVIIVKPTEKAGNVINSESEGNYNGVNFSYSLGKSVRSMNFLRRRIDDIIGPYIAAVTVIKNKYDVGMLIGSNSFYHPMIFKIMFRFFGIKFYAERTELMFHNKKKAGLYKIKNKIYEKIIYKNLDGFFVISNQLLREYSKLKSKRCKLGLIPVIVDENEIYKPEITRSKNLVYTGPLTQKKDGILTIIQSFFMIAKNCPETDLIMTGDIDSTPDKDKILSLVNNSEFKSRVKFLGFMSRKGMIELINSACGLVLAKPLSDQSDTCFPTKLGEYLSTGNPVVITKTGEIPMYLKDGVNAYIAEPGSAESFAFKLAEMLNDPEKAKAIGMKGRQVAIGNFNYRNVMRKVENIIRNSTEGITYDESY